MNEKDLDSQIRDLILIGQWDIAFHVFEQGCAKPCPRCGLVIPGQYARRSEKGFPDYFLVRGHRVVALEVKGTGGKLTDDQVICLELLRLTRKVEVYALWPEDSDFAVALLL